jgi:hypothetical protein
MECQAGYFRVALVVALLGMPTTSAGQQTPVRLEHLTRIGCVECTGPTMFAGIQTIAIGDGRIVVADRVAPYLRVFDASGKVLRAFAGKGNGPGELQLPIHIGPRPGSQLEVYDMTQRRFTRFDSTGSAVHTRPLTDFAVMVTSPTQRAESYIITSDFRSQEQPILLIADANKEPAKVAALKPDFPLHAPGEHARTPAFAARPGGGFAVGDGIAEYRIRRYDRDGKALGDIVRTIPKRRKTSEELALEKEQMQRRAARIAAMRRAEGGSPSFGAFTPREESNHFSIDALNYDDAGRLWVRTDRGGLSTTIFDLFDPAGKYLGELRVPEKIGPYALGSGLLAGKVTDADEVEYVSIWRVTSTAKE